MLMQYFSMHDGHPSQISIAKHRKELQPNSSFFHLAAHLANSTARYFWRLNIEKMPSQNVIKPTQVKWTPPIVFVPKEDGSLCLCVDYWKLNKSKWQDYYLHSRMNACIEYLDKTTVFSTLDASSGNWWVKVEDKGRDKTVVHVPSWALPFCIYAVSFRDCTRFDVRDNGRYPCKRLVKLCPDIPRKHCNSLEDPEKPADDAKQMLTLLQRAEVTFKLNNSKVFYDAIY